MAQQETLNREGNPVADVVFNPAHDWERVAILEVRVSSHEDSIKHLFTHQEKLAESLDSISKTLLQIKYVVLGALGVVMITEIGLIDALKALL